jgi:hypothetical protein
MSLHLPRAPKPFVPLRIAAVAGLAALTAACGAPDSGGGAGSVAPSAAEVGYAAPPSLTGAVRQGARLALSGRAPPYSQVQLASPEGQRYAADADAGGAWRLDLPAPSTPGMFAFAAQEQDRVVRGEGAVLITPSPGPSALLLRPGFGALSPGAPGDQPRIVAVDYDASGGAAVAGLARAGAAVRLSVDDEAAGLGQADALGRFAVAAANRTLASGPHRIEVETEQGRAQVVVDVSPAAPLGPLAYRAARRGDGWRVDWAPPGGGVQTSLVFDGATAP